MRNVTLRLLEPVGAQEEHARETARVAATWNAASIAMEGVTVRAAGHTILEDINLRIDPAEHVAIVGPSGAGKSSLVGLLLGWHRAAAGRILVDGRPLEAERLRGEAAWVDPQIQLWNRSLFDNLRYGTPNGAALAIDAAIEAAELRGVLRKLPDGLQTKLGEGGALVSGGEGQRVRLGRALLRPGARLAILDEPARGLDRGLRRIMLRRARQNWKNATLLCITHDVGETREFERVIVIAKGRIVEDGSPAELLRNPESKYRAMLSAEEAVRTGTWASAIWRRLSIRDGVLQEEPPAGGARKETVGL